MPCHPKDYNLSVVEAFLLKSLKQYKLEKSHQPGDILVKLLMLGEEQASPGTIDEIQVALLKTAGLEIIKKLDRERTVNKQKFTEAIQLLFNDNDPTVRPFYAGVIRLLHQFRLYGTYEAREIIAEAFIRGIKQIESGKLIETPLAWLRTTCLNVIRDFRREQDRAERPKLDPTSWEGGDQVLAELMLQEDLESIALAAQKLTPEEQALLYERVCKEQSWQEVSESISTDESPVSCGTVRQRGSRALKKLRQHYDDIRDVVKLPDDSDGEEDSSCEGD